MPKIPRFLGKKTAKRLMYPSFLFFSRAPFLSTMRDIVFLFQEDPARLPRDMKDAVVQRVAEELAVRFAKRDPVFERRKVDKDVNGIFPLPPFVNEAGMIAEDLPIIAVL